MDRAKLAHDHNWATNVQLTGMARRYRRPLRCFNHHWLEDRFAVRPFCSTISNVLKLILQYRLLQQIQGQETPSILALTCRKFNYKIAWLNEVPPKVEDFVSGGFFDAWCSVIQQSQSALLSWSVCWIKVKLKRTRGFKFWEEGGKCSGQTYRNFEKSVGKDKSWCVCRKDARTFTV